MDFVGKATPLDPGDITTEAQKLGVEEAAIWAVCDVESSGSGFLQDGRPKILFEAHYFHTLTRGRYDRAYPNISSPYWDRTLYGASGAHQYDRLEIAIGLDRTAGLESASWGKFQIMGANFEVCGYANVEAFVSDMMEAEANHLEAFGQFCVNNSIVRYLQDHDWSHFALYYNGSGNVANYAGMLRDAYFRHLAMQPSQNPSGPSGTLQIGSTGPFVLTLQQQLVKLGYNIVPDSDFGPRTKAAVIDFQTNHNLTPDGVVGPLTQAAITAELP